MFRILARMIGSPAAAGGHDRIERRVNAVIDAIRSGDLDRIEAAYGDLGPLNTGSVIAELFLDVDDVTSGVDESALLQAAALPMPPNPEEMLRAVAARDLAALQRAVDSDRLEKALACLMVLIAALRDARPRVLAAGV